MKTIHKITDIVAVTLLFLFCSKKDNKSVEKTLLLKKLLILTII